MPELPDLQAFSHNLNRRVKGKTVKEVTVAKGARVNVSAGRLKKAVEKQTLQAVRREGKELYLEFGDDTILSLHLMLHGALHFPDSTQHRHMILQLDFDDGTALTLTDYRRMATLTLNPEPPEAPDALSSAVSTRFLKEQLAAKRTTIKSFLTDQHIIRGIGNAYADEILWDARISPFSICNKIPAAKISVLARAIKDVLKQAEKQILKAHPDIISGETRDFLSVHNPAHRKSPSGAVIRTKVSGARKTYYTDEQELFQ